MTNIMLIRHGETEWNREEIFRGRADIELNDTGLMQADLLAKYLAFEEIEAIYSSPLKRALKTAEKIAAYHHIGVDVASGLVDFDYGEWQGLSHDLVKQKYGPLYNEWIKSPHLSKIPKAESLDEVRGRAVRLVDQIVSRHEGTAVLVTHRVISKVLICALSGLDISHFWDIRVDTCGITTFTHEGDRFALVRHNDTTFLEPLGKAKLGDF